MKNIHKGKELTKDEVMEGRSSAYNFLEFGEKENKTAEEETLEKVKYVLSANNSSQAIRVIEQYGFWREEKAKEGLYTEEEVLEQLNIFHNMKSSTVDLYTDDEDNITIKWFETLNK